jgi:hypothetical protein
MARPTGITLARGYGEVLPPLARVHPLDDEYVIDVRVQHTGDGR